MLGGDTMPFTDVNRSRLQSMYLSKTRTLLCVCQDDQIGIRGALKSLLFQGLGLDSVTTSGFVFLLEKKK